MLLSFKGSGTSALFDIALQGESDGHISHHQHLGSPVKLEVKLKSSNAISYETTGSGSSSLDHGSRSRSSNASTDSDSTITCYSPNWVTFIPDIIIDAKQGLMWKVQLKLDSSFCKRYMHLNKIIVFLHQMVRLRNEILIEFFLQRYPSSPKDMALPKLVGFLLQRYGSKMLLLDVLLHWSMSEESDLQSVGTAFDLINR